LLVDRLDRIAVQVHTKVDAPDGLLPPGRVRQPVVGDDRIQDEVVQRRESERSMQVRGRHGVTPTAATPAGCQQRRQDGHAAGDCPAFPRALFRVDNFSEAGVFHGCRRFDPLSHIVPTSSVGKPRGHGRPTDSKECVRGREIEFQRRSIDSLDQLHAPI
jgi:hypothetical protein